MNKQLFVIGMRRSGTSILRTLLDMHPDIELLFEPHELLFTCQSIHIPRYKRSQYHIDTLNKFKNSNKKYFGAKIALNCGIEAMNWRWLEDKFDKPYYVFIIRKAEDTFNSWFELDKKIGVRGVVPYDMYLPWWKHINHSFYDCVKANPERAIMVSYKDMIQDADSELEKVWDMLKLKPIKNLDKYIKKPKNWSK